MLVRSVSSVRASTSSETISFGSVAASGDETTRAALGAHVRRSRKRVEAEVELVERAGLGVEDAKVREAVRVVTHRRSGRRPRNAYELAPKVHGGVAELGLAPRGARARSSVADALEVPPAAAIAREHEVARRAPLGLPDRLDAVLACDVLDVRRRSPSDARSATWSSQPSHGIHGRFQARKQSRVPSGEMRGLE